MEYELMCDGCDKYKKEFLTTRFNGKDYCSRCLKDVALKIDSEKIKNSYIKWNDAKKEWPIKYEEENCFLLYDTSQKRYEIGYLDENAIDIRLLTRDYQVFYEKNDEQDFFWCYLDDIPKPE